MFKLRLIPGIFNLKSRISYKSIYVQHVQILGFLQVLLPNILAVLVSCSIRGLTYLLRQPDRKPFLGAARGGQQAPVQNNDIQWTANEVHCRTHQKMEKSIPANIVCTSVHCSFILFHPFLEAAMQKSSAQTRNQQIWRQLSYSSTSPVAGILLNPGPWLPEGHQVLRLSPSRSPASNIPSLRKDQKKYFTSGIYHLSILPPYHLFNYVQFLIFPPSPSPIMSYFFCWVSYQLPFHPISNIHSRYVTTKVPPFGHEAAPHAAGQGQADLRHPFGRQPPWVAEGADDSWKIPRWCTVSDTSSNYHPGNFLRKSLYGLQITFYSDITGVDKRFLYALW